MGLFDEATDGLLRRVFSGKDAESRFLKAAMSLLNYFRIMGGVADLIESFHDRDGGPKTERMVRQEVWAHEQLRASYDKGDDGPVRLLSGGPGSGKSTVAKMLTKDLAADGKRALFVPLHELKLHKNLEQAVREWAKGRPPRPENPLDLKSDDPRLLVIFDGLDELAMAGKVAQQ